jgi:hypothetical protein
VHGRANARETDRRDESRIEMNHRRDDMSTYRERSEFKRQSGDKTTVVVYNNTTVTPQRSRDKETKR